MAISEELQRRISSLTGETGAQMTEAEGERLIATDTDKMKNFQKLREVLGAQVTERELQRLMDSPKMDMQKALRDISGGQMTERELQKFMSLPETQEAGVMSDQEMNMMMANQGARQGISPVEQRAVAFTSYLNTTDRTAPEEVVNNYAMGNMSFDDAIQLSQPIQVIDEVVVTGQMPDMAQEQRQAMAAGMTTPVGGGAISNAEMGMMQPSAGSTDAKMMELQQALQVLQQQMGMTNDPEEKEILGRMIENATTKAFAPQADIVDQLSQGAGEDDMMAHVRSGDINVSREMLENNPALEDAIEGAALEVGIDPESMVYGTGIASLNEVTGAEQHGFLKKIAKGVKKVVKVIAPVAAIVPGPWQAPAIVYNKGKAAINLVKGEGGIGDIMTVMAGGSQKLLGDKGALKSITSGDFLESGGGFKDALKGIGSIEGEFKPFEYAKNIGQQYKDDQMQGYFGLLGGGEQQPQGVTQEQYDQMTPEEQAVILAQQNQASSPFNIGRKILGEGNTSNFFKGIEDTIKGQTGPTSNSLFANLPSMPSFRNENGLTGMGMLGIGALAAGLGKLAYEDTKKDKGVQLTPLNTMNAAGRYNLEAEIARRMGQQAPNPTEFGLLPANTLPQLSGGQPREVMTAAQGGEVDYPNKGLESLAKVAPDVVKRMGYNMGGYVMPMAYAEGGNVAIEDFDRMNGQINGEGTETSDDVPAMLSDGEFVMTGQAVRGAGSYNMNNESGIITLSPTGAPSRDGGTDLMYQLMEAFSSQARPA